MIKISRLATVAAFVAVTVAGQAHAQSLVGRWDGTTNTQQGRQAMTLTFDSVATGWKGGWSSEAAGGGPLSFVEIKKDTVSFSFSVQNTSVDFQGTLTADRKTINGYIWFAGNNAGTFQVVRIEPAKTPPPRH